MSTTQEIPRIVLLKDIEEVVQQNDFAPKLMNAIAQGFVAYDQGDFCAAPIQTLGVPPFAFIAHNDPDYAGQVCVKSGYFRNTSSFVIKVASGGHPLPNSGLLQVYSQATGKLQALLLDEGVLTEWRTAAVGSLAVTLFFANANTLQSIGMVGTGIQSRYQLRMLASITQCRNVVVWGRTVAKVQAWKDELMTEGWNVTIVDQVDDMLDLCEVIITTTCAREPLLGTTSNQTKPKSTHLIVCIGADAPGKQEINQAWIQEHANLLVADSLEQTRTRGEFQHLPSTTVIHSLGKAIQEKSLQRQGPNDDRLIIFDSSGVALQDCVVAQMVLDALSTSS